MNRQSAELAKFSVEAYSDQLTELYQETREEFLAELALRETGLSDLKARSVNDRVNANFITAFVSQLPRAHRISERDWRLTSRSDFGFKVTDPNEARALQANVLWLIPRVIIMDRVEAYPAYIVGESKGKGPKDVLLASAAGEHANKLATFQPKLTDRRRAAAKPVLARPFYTDKDMEAMYDHDDHTLHVTASTKGSVEIAHSGLGDVLLYGVRRGRVKEDEPRLQSIKRVSDEAIERLSILDRLNELAKLFGKKDALIAMIDRHFLSV